MNKKQILAAMLGVAMTVPSTHALCQQPGGNASGSATPEAGQRSPVRLPPQKENTAAGRPVLRTISLPPYLLNDVANEMGLQYGRTPGVTVTPDMAKGHLLVMAPPQLQKRIEKEIREMLESGHVRRVGRQIPIANTSKQFPLRQISWREFEDGLQMLAGKPLQCTTTRNGELASFRLVQQPVGQADVTVDRRANSVTVLAPEPTLAGWQKLISALDVGGSDPNAIMEMARLENAEPAPIQRAIELLRRVPVSGGPSVGVAGNGIRFTTAAQEGAAAPANPQAGNGGQDQVEAVVPADGEDGGLIGNVQIEFVPELGILIVRGPKRDVQRVMSVIEEIEAKAELTQPQIEVLMLQHVDSDAMAELVTRLYEDALGERGSEITVISLGKPNALLLIGRDVAIEAAKDLVDKLDTPVAPATQLKVFRLANASAVDAEEAILEFYDPEEDDDDVTPGLDPRVRVVADYRTNSLVVQAGPRDMAEVAKLIAELDVDSVPAENVIRVFPLQNALADELATVLQDAITGAETTDENFTRPSTTLSIISKDNATGQAIRSGLLAGLSVNADTNSNALIVRGPASSMALVKELIEQLDALPGAEALIKVFQLQFSDATTVSNALTQLFSQQQQQGGGGFGGAGASPFGVPQISAANENSLVQLRFSTDPRTNSVIAVGSASDLEVVESVVLRLDIEGFSTRQNEVIWLRNADAVRVATAIQEYVRLRNQTAEQLLPQGGQTAAQLGVYDFVDRDLIVVAEELTNSLLVNASPRLYPEVIRLIDQLDRRPPDVLVKVIIAEVSLGDGFEWGSEFGVQDSLLFDRGVAGVGSDPGFRFNNNGTPNLSSAGRDDLAAQTLSTFGMGRSNTAFGYGGFVFAAASDSVSLLLRSLQDANRAQILSRPMVMARDATEGLVQVGATVPRVTGVTQGGQGFAGTQVTTQDEEVGLILRIQPRVGADGTIRMIVDAERSQVGPLAEGIPVGFAPDGSAILSPQIERTRAQTTVTAYDGQTVVLGGLIQKERTQFSRRIPYVSDIPLLGALFRYDQEIEERNELLIVMTPHIVTTEQDQDYIKRVESSRMSWCLADVVEMHGDVGLSGGYGLWGPAIGPVIYPDATPMIDDIREVHQSGTRPPEGSIEGGAIMEAPNGMMLPEPIEEGLPEGASPLRIDPRAGSLRESGPALIEPAPPVSPEAPVKQVGFQTVKPPQRIPSVKQ